MESSKGDNQFYILSFAIWDLIESPALNPLGINAYNRAEIDLRYSSTVLWKLIS